MVNVCDAHWVGRGDLTNEQWVVLEPLLPKNTKPGRPPKHPKRQLIDGTHSLSPRIGNPYFGMDPILLKSHRCQLHGLTDA